MKPLLTISAILFWTFCKSQTTFDSFTWKSKEFLVYPTLFPLEGVDPPKNMPTDGNWIGFYSDSTVAFTCSYKADMYVDTLKTYAGQVVQEYFVFQDGRTVKHVDLANQETTTVQGNTIIQELVGGRRVFVIPKNENSFQPIFRVYESVFNFCVREEIDEYNLDGKLVRKVVTHDGITYDGPNSSTEYFKLKETTNPNTH